MKTSHSLVLAVAFWAATPLAAAPADEADGSGQVVVVKRDYKDEDVRFGSKTVDFFMIRKAVEDALAGHPAGASARLTLQPMRFVSPEMDHSVEHAGMLVGPASVVALDGNGQPDGMERVYARGLLVGTTPWKHGKKNGEEIIYENGRIKATIPWVDGKMQGILKTFHPDGTLMAETNYIAGEAAGLSRSTDEQGRVVQEATLKHGKRDGIAKDFWPETGKLRREIPYEMGRVEGVAKEFYPSGILKRELPFKNNAMNGMEIDYDDGGKVSQRQYWLDGDPVTQAEFEKKAAK